MAVGQKSGSKMAPWCMEPKTKTRVTPALQCEPHPYDLIITTCGPTCRGAMLPFPGGGSQFPGHRELKKGRRLISAGVKVAACGMKQG